MSDTPQYHHDLAAAALHAQHEHDPAHILTTTHDPDEAELVLAALKVNELADRVVAAHEDHLSTVGGGANAPLERRRRTGVLRALTHWTIIDGAPSTAIDWDYTSLFPAYAHLWREWETPYTSKWATAAAERAGISRTGMLRRLESLQRELLFGSDGQGGIVNGTRRHAAHVIVDIPHRHWSEGYVPLGGPLTWPSKGYGHHQRQVPAYMLARTGKFDPASLFA